MDAILLLKFVTIGGLGIADNANNGAIGAG